MMGLDFSGLALFRLLRCGMTAVAWCDFVSFALSVCFFFAVIYLSLTCYFLFWFGLVRSCWNALVRIGLFWCAFFSVDKFVLVLSQYEVLFIIILLHNKFVR
jgi:hypothetical protein